MDNSHLPALLGKSIWTYDATRRTTPDDIEQFIRKFELNSALKLIGQVSTQHTFKNENGDKPSLLMGVPVANGALAYIAMKLIEGSNDYRRRIMSLRDLVQALDMYFGLEVLSKETDDTLSYLMRLGASQFDYDASITHLMPRTLIIYGQLWSGVEKAQSIDVLRTIEEISGLDLKMLVAFGLAYTGSARHGFVQAYSKNALDNFEGATEATALKFVKYISGTYQQFRHESRSEHVPEPYLEPYRSNPVQWYPLLVPDRQPVRNSPDVYMAPIPTLILRRVTNGLYTALSEHFRGEKSTNSFRTAFGYVFEAYVGRLIEKSLIRGDVRSERAYSAGRGSEKLSTDWMILEGENLVIIEVKQAGLRRAAKAWGDLNDVAKDLVLTLGKAVRQLYLFERDIRSGEFSALSDLTGVKAIERLVITHDQLHFNNWILQEQIREGLRQKFALELPYDYTFHVASIEDLENIVASCGTSLFEFLRKKSDNQTFKEFDFQEYLAHSDVVTRENAYLEAVHNDFMADLSMRARRSSIK